MGHTTQDRCMACGRPALVVLDRQPLCLGCYNRAMARIGEAWRSLKELVEADDGAGTAAG